MQVPLDEHGYCTIVMSREEDRPANATEENGVAWMEWSPRGETGSITPRKITAPGTEAEVMGSFYSSGEYMDKATFEARGVKK